MTIGPRREGEPNYLVAQVAAGGSPGTPSLTPSIGWTGRAWSSRGVEGIRVSPPMQPDLKMDVGCLQQLDGDAREVGVDQQDWCRQRRKWRLKLHPRQARAGIVYAQKEAVNTLDVMH